MEKVLFNMADFNRSFLDHLKKSEEERAKELVKISSTKRRVVKYPGEKLLRKYKLKLWHKLVNSRKKENKLLDTASSNLVRRTAWPKNSTVHRNFKINSNPSFDPALLPELGPCTDFPIAEIGTEVNGNRNNGNSPFNSSSSCNSPPDSHLFTKTESTQVNMCQKCRVRNSEQNNNTDLRCTCIKVNVSHKDLYSEQKCHEVDMDYENSDLELEHDDSNKSETIQEEQVHGNDAQEPFIDVESLDDSGETKNTQSELAENSDHMFEMSENGIDNQRDHLEGHKCEQSKSASHKQPIDWQQQFMSFISSSSSATTCTTENDNHEVELKNDVLKSHHSPKRKRSRKVRQSMCPCCLGSTHKKDHEDLVRYRKPHSSMRSHRKFIRDMTQLVSLRNKVMEVCKVLFPTCVGEIFNYVNVESEDVDKCVDQMISILHNAHQQFLQNLNSKTERNLNNKTTSDHLKRGKSSINQSNNDHTNSIENIVSNLGSTESKDNENNDNVQETMDDIELEASSAPSLFCSQTDQLTVPNSPQLLSDICLPDNEDIVYAIPVENGIAYPEQTQVLMAGNSEQLDFCSENQSEHFNESVFSEEKSDEQKLHVDVGKEQNRMLSEADSGIVNDHDLSSPEEKQDKNNVFHKTSLLWDGSFSKSKTNAVSAKSEHTASNIFDLLASYTPTKSDSKEEKSDHSAPESETSAESSHETIKAENKSTVKDRNIFDSLFNMNVDPTVSEPAGSSIDVHLNSLNTTDDEICDQEVQGFYLAVNDFVCEKSVPEKNQPEPTYVEVYDPAIVLCKKPKICLHAFKEKVSCLIKWLLPEITFEKSFLRNTDNIEYVLDALVLCNKK